MPNYKEQEEAPGASKSPLSSLVRWLQIKKYQYEVTFSLYMLTSTEKIVFNVIILVLFTLLIAAAVAYLPNHIAVISNRLWYYVHGEFLFATAAGGSSGAMQQSPAAAAAASGKSLLLQQAATASSVVRGAMSATAEEAVRRAGEL